MFTAEKRMNFVEALVVAIREADTVYQTLMLSRLLCRLDLQEGHEEISSAWADMLARMQYRDVHGVMEMLAEKERRAVEMHRETIWQ